MGDIHQGPIHYTGPQDWRGPYMAKHPGEWLYHWTSNEIAEIELAADSVADLDILDITIRDFPLPTIEATLADIKSDILHGRGFAMLRGLPVDEWSMDKTARVYWGLGVHMGLPVSQNSKGHALGHVKNIRRDMEKATSRGYERTDRLAFHTDTADIVGLFCRKPAKAGGDSLIVSSTAIYNEIARRRPDLAAVLMQPLQRSFVSENPDDQNRLVDVPLFMHEDGRMIGHYVRGHIYKAQALPGVRLFTDEQKEALALVDSIAEDPAFFLDMEFRLGDIQFLCNHTILHSRCAFQDFEDFGERRHLLRLWLACKDGPILPHWMINAYDSGRANGRQDGYHRRSIPLKVPLDAE